MHQILSVQKCQRFNHRLNHPARFFRIERAPRKNVSQILVRVFLNNIEVGRPLHPAFSAIEKLQQVGMGNSNKLFPSRKLFVRVHFHRRNELDGNLHRSRVHNLCRKDTAVIGSAEVFPKHILSGNALSGPGVLLSFRHFGLHLAAFS